MSVMLPEDFTQIARTLWPGDDWKALAAKRLERSERQLRNIELGETKKVMPALRDELMAVVREQILVLQAFDKQFS